MTIPGLDKYVARNLAAAPPLSNEQVERLACPFAGESGASLPRPARPRLAKPTTVYRHYDRCGCLLYVGVAYDAVQRNYAHNGQSWWSPWIDRIQLDETTYVDRRAALDAEREFIRSEAPVFNTVHAPAGRDSSIIRYLIKHERWEHLSVGAPVGSSQKPQLLRTLAETDLLDGVTWMKEPVEHEADWSDPLLRRFIAKTETDDRGCWKWQGYFRDHHPVFRHPKTRMATRAAWLLFRGPLPDGVRVEQLCGMHDCVNHRHLRTVPVKVVRKRYSGSIATCEVNHPGAPSRWMRRSDGRSACRECNRIQASRRRAAPSD